MIAVVNCFMLWSLTWLQFLINFAFFSYEGHNLWFYITSTIFFGLTVPELFLLLSIVLSFFSVGAVIFGTRQAPKLWKRIVMVSIFSSITIGISLISLHLRHFSYQAAVNSFEFTSQRYERNLASDSKKDWLIEYLHLEKKNLEQSAENIQKYEVKYGKNEN